MGKTSILFASGDPNAAPTSPTIFTFTEAESYRPCQMTACFLGSAGKFVVRFHDALRLKFNCPGWLGHSIGRVDNSERKAKPPWLV